LAVTVTAEGEKEVSIVVDFIVVVVVVVSAVSVVSVVAAAAAAICTVAVCVGRRKLLKKILGIAWPCLALFSCKEVLM